MVRNIIAEIDRVNANGRFKPEDDSLKQFRVPDWYMDGKFGIFIHWGPYAVPAFGNEWYPRNMYLEGSKEYEHHIKTYGDHRHFGYKDFLPMFKAERFDPEQWVDTFARSGAKYVVPVAEHHDGFQMYESELCRFNSSQMGPKRNVLGELKEQFGEKGLVLGVSSHRIEHWWFMEGGRKFDSDVLDPEFADFYGPLGKAPEDGNSRNYTHGPSDEFMDDWLARCCELVDRYRPKLFYFDWWIQIHSLESHLRRFVAYYYNRADEWGEQVAVNFKLNALPVEAAVFDVERGGLGDIRYPFWQSDTALARNSWGYTHDQTWKFADEIIGDLCDIVSKNGALLLNVGPKADGTIPDEDKKLLLAVGKWLEKNGEAIYATRPYSVYGEGPTNIAEGAFTDGERRMYTPDDIRFTTKNGLLYAIALAPPKDGKMVIRTLRRGGGYAPSAVNAVILTATGEPLPFDWDDDSLRISVNADEAFAVTIR